MTTTKLIPLDEIWAWFDDGDVVYNDRDLLDAMQAHFPNTDPRVIDVVAYTANQDGQGTVDGIHRCLEDGFLSEAAFLGDFERHHPATEGDRAQWENTMLIALPDSERGHVWVFDSDERFWDRLGAYRRQQEGQLLREVAEAVIAQADGHDERRVRVRL
ncbi:hypothetical protein [Burkholderia vietnamiensis]|uniref:hypothetical protein n=1 Tax=Burkholderia vietnamiensis TaxID=60552 RepID=UPI001B8F757F|nr:hypothetical protein [Burkholderia vietnamiensis]MBR8000415.1 hypothetical protein [Burkholderia vietnamiensis]MCA8451718.1 hypothetical protein [Burkholderia vietnamiensis]HDR8954952.1 hypothetical protein [Burkholderia vietnamiensis]